MFAKHNRIRINLPTKAFNLIYKYIHENFIDHLKIVWHVYAGHTLVFLITDQAPNNHPGHQNSGFS